MMFVFCSAVKRRIVPVTGRLETGIFLNDDGDSASRSRQGREPSVAGPGGLLHPARSAAQHPPLDFGAARR